MGILDEFLTKSSNADEAFAGFGAFCENVQLPGQLFALGTILVGFTGDAGNEAGWHRSDRYRGKYIVKWGDEFSFNDLDSDIVDKTLQCDLFTNVAKLTSGSIEVGEDKEGKPATL